MLLCTRCIGVQNFEALGYVAEAEACLRTALAVGEVAADTTSWCDSRTQLEVGAGRRTGSAVAEPPSFGIAKIKAALASQNRARLQVG